MGGQENSAKALPLYERALAIREREWGEPSNTVITSDNLAGMVIYHRECFANDLPHTERILSEHSADSKS